MFVFLDAASTAAQQAVVCFVGAKKIGGSYIF
jgi:hypothetical protein